MDAFNSKEYYGHSLSDDPKLRTTARNYEFKVSFWGFIFSQSYSPTDSMYVYLYSTIIQTIWRGSSLE